MEKTIKWYQPEAKSGSFAIALLAHGALYGSVLVYFAIAGSAVAPPAETNPQEMTYDTFSAPPAPAPLKHVVKVAKPTPVETTTPVAAKAHEMQDEKSAVAGTQTAAPPPAAAAASGTGDTADTPYYKIKPNYPKAALISGTEGYIVMKIDINESGLVENVRVTGGAQRNMFQDEARRAVEKWKYKPFLDAAGKPKKILDHEVRVDFKLQDAA